MPSDRGSQCASVKANRLLAQAAPVIVASVVDTRGLYRVLRAKHPTWNAVELRLDRIGFGPYVRRAARELERRGMPVVVTVRMTAEGGAWKVDSRARERIYRSFLDLVSAVDVEIRSERFARIARVARLKNVAVIGSFHDFEGVPSATALTRLAKRGWARGANVVKIAATVKSSRDVATLKRLLGRFAEQRRLCVIGMSETKPDVRIELARAGSFLAYGSVGTAAAPGQVSCATLKRRLGKAVISRSIVG